MEEKIPLSSNIHGLHWNQQAAHDDDDIKIYVNLLCHNLKMYFILLISTV